jgi:hypothetical protein
MRRDAPEIDQRVAVLSGHQVGDGGFEVSAAKISLRERRAKPAKIIDDEVIVFGRTRNNRGPVTHTQLPLLYGQGWGWDLVFSYEGPAFRVGPPTQQRHDERRR